MIPFMSRNIIVMVPSVSPKLWHSLPSSLHIAFDHTSRIRGSSISFLYLLIVSLVTGCTTPFATSYGPRVVSLTFIILFMSWSNVLPTNWCNAAIAMPAVRELT